MRIAPKNSITHPQDNFTVPAKAPCQDLNGKKLKKSRDFILTAIMVNKNRIIINTAVNLNIAFLLFNINIKAAIIKIQTITARL